MTRIKAVLFDKDGTLFDFHATWSAWSATMLLDLAAGDPARASALGALIGYDMTEARFDPTSEVIAGTPEDIVTRLAPAVPELSRAQLIDRLNSLAAEAVQVPAVPLKPLFGDLRARGLALGIATNDAEVPARAHLTAAGVAEEFDFIAGYDSGHGGKPAPGMCLAFAAQMGLAPDSVVMVGDSTHDLEAGRAAGMRCVAVLTGLAGPEDLAPLADAVLPDIGALPQWLLSQNLL